ncbi:hypothetical protein AMAG_04697 [Allomyces macrogynus ATCC 38327]|uniref:Prolyl endopeptidase n=1 Tax=Allomyces macrogynus (strain ATCC 38327) TaxID=578462 RepID=A0A0L0S5S1_ALLM3|nr:hypothetical protein AMAG_04697 [Allomyces macrogynus ATCC 38327]|eukprot:KNE57852.1 hypothetical protein AMAG_04697 [Allomyces macrogynus ATCC 38327]
MASFYSRSAHLTRVPVLVGRTMINNSAKSTAVTGITGSRTFLSMPGSRSLKAPKPPAMRTGNTVDMWGQKWDDLLQHLRTDQQALFQFIDEENKHADAYFKRTRNLTKSLFKEMNDFLRVESTPRPVPDVTDGWEYWSETTPRGPVHYRRRQFSKEPRELVLDASRIPGTLKKVGLSPNHQFIAYVVEATGNEWGTLSVHEIGSKDPPAQVENVRAFSFEWVDDETVAYTVCNDQLRPDRVVVGKWRDPVEKHTTVHVDPVAFIDVSKTKDKRFVTINCNTLESSEVLAIDTQAPLDPPRLIQAREDGVQYYVDHHTSQFYILTNADGAEDFKLVTAPTATPSKQYWRDEQVPLPGDKIEDIDLFADHIVMYVKRGGASAVQVRDVQGETAGAVHDVPLPPGTTVQPGINMDYHVSSVRMTLQHPYAHASIFDYDMKKRHLLPRQIQPLPIKEFDASEYDITRVWVTSRDELARIPVTLLHKKGMSLDGCNPVNLRAYGAYGICMEPMLRLDTLSLLKRGWIVAVAHVRGGSELGRQWHTDGKLLVKKNTFHDVIDVAEFLCQQGFSQPDLMTATGTSAGGMTIATAALYRPDLFRAIVLHSPFVDVLTSMLDKSLPLTQTEFLEWGNPQESAAVFNLIADYSPYEQLRRICANDTPPASLPALFVTSGLRDQRTPAWQVAKFVGMWRHVLARTDRSAARDLVSTCATDGGHFGNDELGQSGRLEDMAEEVSFLLDQVSGTHMKLRSEMDAEARKALGDGNALAKIAGLLKAKI